MHSVLSKRILGLALGVAAIAGIAAQSQAYIIVDDYEGYANAAALETAYTTGQATVMAETLDTGVAHGGSQSMKIDYTAGNAPYFGQTRLDFAAQDWTPYDKVTFWYLGLPGNSQETFGFRIYNSFGVEIGRIEYTPASDALKAATWTQGVLDLTPFSPADLNNVAQLRVAITPFDYGSGTIWIDDIVVGDIPEPASLGLLGAGALMLARRRRLV